MRRNGMIPQLTALLSDPELTEALEIVAMTLTELSRVPGEAQDAA